MPTFEDLSALNERIGDVAAAKGKLDCDSGRHLMISSVHPEKPAIWMRSSVRPSSGRPKPLEQSIPGLSELSHFGSPGLRSAEASKANSLAVILEYERRGTLGADAKSSHEQTQSFCDS